jgi:hypothetical protein
MRKWSSRGYLGLNVFGKKEAPTVSTTGFVEKYKFTSPSVKPKDDEFMPGDCVVVELGGK